MNIIVKKPSEAEKAEMTRKPIWTCGVSEFDWYYDSEETCLLLEGEVEVAYAGGSVRFGAGDYVVFPQGLACVWKVLAPVKKHYVFR
ncbi:MAG: cupin domain-containing protein [Clostridiales bacterium]|nr:cupin domain-containing protein [Clostridiales bacterium]